MESELTEAYYKKLEETNQLLEARNSILETENKNLIAKIKELDPNFWKSEFEKDIVKYIQDTEDSLFFAQVAKLTQEQWDKKLIKNNSDIPFIPSKTTEQKIDDEITKEMKKPRNRGFF